MNLPFIIFFISHQSLCACVTTCWNSIAFIFFLFSTRLQALGPGGLALTNTGVIGCLWGITMGLLAGCLGLILTGGSSDLNQYLKNGPKTFCAVLTGCPPCLKGSSRQRMWLGTRCQVERLQHLSRRQGKGLGQGCFLGVSQQQLERVGR